MGYTTSVLDYFKQLPDHVKQVLDEYKKNLTVNRFFKYKDYIKSESKEVLFNKNRWEQKPYLFCHDYYSPSEQYLYPVILTVNCIKSVYDFLPDNFENQIILAPDVRIIREILTRK